MAKNTQLESWEHILLRPCYSSYLVYRHATLAKLHDAWEESEDNMDGLDLEIRVQAWHNLMALAKCFRERYEWDSKLRCPKPLIIEIKGCPMWVTNGIKPDTPEWLEHWRAYPKEQASMARHSLRLKRKEA